MNLPLSWQPTLQIADAKGNIGSHQQQQHSNNATLAFPPKLFSRIFFEVSKLLKCVLSILTLLKYLFTVHLPAV
jgi:hypothetical protein